MANGIEEKIFNLSIDEIAVLGFMFGLIHTKDLGRSLKRTVDRHDEEAYVDVCLKTCIYILSSKEEDLTEDALDLLEEAERWFKTLASNTSLFTAEPLSLKNLNNNKVDIGKFINKKGTDTKEAKKVDKKEDNDLFSFIDTEGDKDDNNIAHLFDF